MSFSSVPRACGMNEVPNLKRGTHLSSSSGGGVREVSLRVQGYLAHRKPPPPLGAI